MHKYCKADVWQAIRRSKLCCETEGPARHTDSENHRTRRNLNLDRREQDLKADMSEHNQALAASWDAQLRFCRGSNGEKADA
jgi:hypothetical protein